MRQYSHQCFACETQYSVILDAIHKAGLINKIPIVFVDTYTLFPESMAHLREVEKHYGFEAKVYAAQGCTDQADYISKYGNDYWMKDIDAYDMLCKVEPMNRALKEQDSDCWINGRRRDHGAERAALPVSITLLLFQYILLHFLIHYGNMPNPILLSFVTIIPLC